ACLTTAEAGKGMTTGTHGSTFGANPLAMAVGNAVLDLMLAPEFLDKVRRSAILFRQRLAEIRDRHPGVIAEGRGEGLLLGLLAVCPNGELVEALRAERLLAVTAGDNVVRKGLHRPYQPRLIRQPHRGRRGAGVQWPRQPHQPRPGRKRHRGRLPT